MKALPNQSRETQCLGKEAFQSAQLAKDVAGRKARRSDRRGLNAYKCGWCGFYHIGHHINRSKKPRFYGDDE